MIIKRPLYGKHYIGKVGLGKESENLFPKGTLTGCLLHIRCCEDRINNSVCVYSFIFITGCSMYYSKQAHEGL